MSLFPCEVHKRRVPGSLESYRITTLLGPDSYTRRVRVCAQHRTAAVDEATAQLVRVTDDFTGEINVLCSACGHSVDGADDLAAVFVWSYPKGQEPEHFYGSVHAQCHESFCRTWGLAPNRGRFETTDQVDTDSPHYQEKQEERSERPRRRDS